VQVSVSAYIFKNIDKLAPTRWDISEEGWLAPTLLVKQRGWNKDSSHVVPFAPETRRTHWRSSHREDTGMNFTTASLRIKPKAPSAKARSR
jgi:hypothetical protein